MLHHPTSGKGHYAFGKKHSLDANEHFKSYSRWFMSSSMSFGNKHETNPAFSIIPNQLSSPVPFGKKNGFLVAR
jgi:hypothetical protein